MAPGQCRSASGRAGGGIPRRSRYRRLRQGDPTGAVTALTRAAELSPTDASRARRLADAAYVGAGTAGGLAAIPRILREAHRADPDSSRSLEAAVATAHVLLNADGDIDTSHRILVGAIEAARPETPPALALIEALNLLCLVCFFGGRQELWPPVDAAINRLGPRRRHRWNCSVASSVTRRMPGRRRSPASIPPSPACIMIPTQLK